jgi:hypothetical protein
MVHAERMSTFSTHEFGDRVAAGPRMVAELGAAGGWHAIC